MEDLRQFWTGDEESYRRFREEMERKADEQVRRYRQERNASEGEVALEALSIYASFLLPPPRWATETIRETWEKFKDGIGDGWWGDPSESQIETCVTFDEALGLRKQTRKTAHARQKKEHLLFPVYLEIERLYHLEGYKLDKEIFILAGEKYGISGGSANEYYQEALRRGHPPVSEIPGEFSPVSGRPLRKK